ncbi:MAG: hypothetical protein RBU30_17380 [Polyangia bacterium]|jgi:hypothetical protein|nr:hypothetical protein [Polyangia bacterium]
MNRLLVSLGLIVLVASLASGCRRQKECDLCPGYCDDSGCYACNDDDFCWPVQNPPCGDGEICEANEYCAPWGCAIVCSFDTDCNVGEQCLPAGYCGPADDVDTPCVSHEDCGNGMFCHDGVCDEACQSDDDCPGDWVCAACGECQPPDNPVCGEYPTLCSDNAECGEGRICTSLGRCAFSCETTDPVCPHGQVCLESVCTDDPAPTSTECITSVDCDSIAACQTLGCLCVNTYCQTLCDQDADCGWGQFCHLGICKADFRPEE